MSAPEYLDIVVIGAGLSGIGAGHHLKENFPTKSFAILEARDVIGGTWDLFRYPGVRSDSDMHTLGYRMRPWTAAEAIADGPSILKYVRDTAIDTGVDKHIRYGHKVVGASWSTPDAQWTLTIDRADEIVEVRCGFLFVCSGYYKYDHGYTPDFPGIESFGGTVVHPQAWPEDLDYADKKVVVIGSGATAVTIVPAMADTAGHVTMLQRSPTYIVPGPSVDKIGSMLKKYLGKRAGYMATRWKNVLLGSIMYPLIRRYPDGTRKMVRNLNIKALPEGYDVDTHFKPDYNPWDQRMCVAPEGDFFKAISAGKASIATDRIKSFTKTGIDLQSGESLEADVVVTATGLRMVMLGGMDVLVDGKPVVIGDTLAYRGSMLEGIPNLVFTIGYTNASWTLKADLVSEFVCRILKYMDESGNNVCTPRNDNPDMERIPLMDFAAGYVLRARSEFPAAGVTQPWRLGMNYIHDLLTLRHKKLEDGALRFTRSTATRIHAAVPTQRTAEDESQRAVSGL